MNEETHAHILLTEWGLQEGYTHTMPPVIKATFFYSFNFIVQVCAVNPGSHTCTRAHSHPASHIARLHSFALRSCCQPAHRAHGRGESPL